MYKLVAAIILGNGIGGRMATAPHYSSNFTLLYLSLHDSEVPISVVQLTLC